MFSLSLRIFLPSIGLRKVKNISSVHRFFSINSKKFGQSSARSVVFFGTDQYAVFALKALLNRLKTAEKSPISRLGVCTRFVEPICDLAKCAKSLDDRLACFDYDDQMDFTGWDVGVVASFGHLIPPELIAAFPYGILCIHPSLLPRWRGASPLMSTILNGDSHCGVSLMRIMPSKFDVGPILRQQKIPLPENVTSRQLGADLMERGVNLLMDVLNDLPGAIQSAMPQSTEGVTYAKKITPKKTFVNWNWSVQEIDCFQRALQEDFGVRARWEDLVVRLNGFLDPDLVPPLRIDELCSEQGISVCGELYFHKKRNVLFVRCQNGWVGVRGVGIPDRRPMTAKDFFNGFLSDGKKGQRYFECDRKK